MLELQQQNSVEQTDVLQRQNQALNDLLAQKDIILLNQEKDYKFMQMQMEEYELQVEELVNQYDQSLLEKEEKCQELS